MARPEKITFADMRDMGVRGLLIYCSDYKCSHLVTMSSDRWPDGMRLSDIERRFVCAVCGKRGADEGDDGLSVTLRIDGSAPPCRRDTSGW
jgi:hypothetical protein